MVIGGHLKKVLRNIEEFIESIGSEELKKNSKASAKALAIKKMIKKLKKSAMDSNSPHLGMLNYVSPKMLLEN